LVFRIFDLLKLARQAQSGFYIRVLSTLVSSCEQNEHFTSNFFEVHPITGPIVDPQFGNALAYRLDISRVSSSEPLNSNLDLARARTSRKLSSQLAKSSVLRISSTGSVA
jgi:hypothetical protein